jgi:hypothetical protein
VTRSNLLCARSFHGPKSSFTSTRTDWRSRETISDASRRAIDMSADNRRTALHKRARPGVSMTPGRGKDGLANVFYNCAYSAAASALINSSNSGYPPAIDAFVRNLPLTTMVGVLSTR